MSNEQPAATVPDSVKMKVLKGGEGKISTGKHVGGEGDVFFKVGETFEVSAADADALDRRRYADFVTK